MHVIRTLATLALSAGLLGSCGVETTQTIPAPAPAAAAAAQGTVYGEPLAEVQTVAVADLLARVDELSGQQVRIEGTVTDVCAKRGCWMKIGSDDAPDTVTFKVQDGVIVIPMSARGKHAVADGTVKKIELSLEDTRKYLAHQAEESGKEFDPASVTEPMVMVRLSGIGARIRDAQ